MKAVLAAAATAATVLLALMPSAHAVAPFEAEIDCGDVHARGATVPYSVRLENEGRRAIELTFTVTVRMPDGTIETLPGDTVQLAADTKDQIDYTLALPDDADLGGYRMRVVAQSGNQTSFDTCSFKVR